MKKIIKRVLLVVLIIIMMLVIIINILPPIRSFRNKNIIFKIVRENQEILNNSIKTGSYLDVLEIEGVKDVHVFTTDEGNTYIDFFCSGFGIVPSGIYYGFYYHSIDEPIGYQGVSVKLTRDGDGWSWSEPYGDNYCYTEKITEHWYYYEAGF